MSKVTIGQIYKCRDERHGKRWVRVIAIGKRSAGVEVKRGRSRKWVASDRSIALSRFSDGKGDYKLWEGKR